MALQPSAPAPRTSLAPQSACILVVEDDPDHRDALRATLEDEGYVVESAANGSAALDRLLRGLLPGAMVVDLMMPVMDGWHLIVELKKRPALAEIPVIVITGGGPSMLVSAPVSAGYMEKPIDSARLLETLAACLARRERKSSGTRPIGG